MASDKIKHITDQQFDSEVNQSSIPVLVDFWAPWCGPCRSLAPVLDELASEYDGKIKIVKMNVDENPSSPQKFSVRGIPTMIFVKNGSLVETLVGNQPKSAMKNTIDTVIK